MLCFLPFGIFYGHLRYFMTICCSLCSFGTFFRFWCHAPRKIWQPWSIQMFAAFSQKIKLDSYARRITQRSRQVFDISVFRIMCWERKAMNSKLARKPVFILEFIFFTRGRCYDHTFLRFSPILVGKNWRFFLKNYNIMINFFAKSSSSLSKKRQYFRQNFRRKYFLNHNIGFSWESFGITNQGCQMVCSQTENSNLGSLWNENCRYNLWPIWNTLLPSGILYGPLV
jgi:hypothetical protein